MWNTEGLVDHCRPDPCAQKTTILGAGGERSGVPPDRSPKIDWPVGLLLAFHVALLLWCGTVTAPVKSEDAHLAAGLSDLYLGRFDLYRVNPPLVRVFAAIPLLTFEPLLPLGRYDTNRLSRSEYAVGTDFVYANKSSATWLMRASRWTCVFLVLCGGYVCWLWASRLLGRTAGFVALAMWCLSPTILGHASTIMPDAHAAAIGVAAMYCFWRWLKRPHWPEATAFGTVLGLAELCKFTFLVFYLLLPVLWIVYRLPERRALPRLNWGRQSAMLAAAMLLSLCVINCGYMFEDAFTPLEGFRFRSTLFAGHDSLKDVPPEGGNPFVGTWLGKLPVPVPANMLQGIDTQRYDFERGLPSYLHGQWADHGWWYYYLYALAIKEPLGTWCLVAMAVGVTIVDLRRRKGAVASGRWSVASDQSMRAKGTVPFSSDKKRDSPQSMGFSASWRDEMIVLAPFFTILIFVSSQTGFSVHSRYIIPALPFLFVWTSKIGRVFEKPSEEEEELTPRREVAKDGLFFAPLRLCVSLFSLRGAVVLMLAWSVGSSLWYYPHSLSYFNELVGGPMGGPKHLLDSNIDWGQDLFYLKDWLDAHPDVKLDGLAYWGSYPTTLAGIPGTPMPPSDPAARDRPLSQRERGEFIPPPGWYALSVNCIYGRDRQYRYFLNHEPAATVGYSIYIYDITPEQASERQRLRPSATLARTGR
jgi:4-amino-4-deoxy-L-arabinose transferase-like glycosyltransferase